MIKQSEIYAHLLKHSYVASVVVICRLYLPAGFYINVFNMFHCPVQSQKFVVFYAVCNADLNRVMPARACEWSRSGRISALRSNLFLWLPLHSALSDLPILLCGHCSQFCSHPLTTPLPLTRLLARSTRILLQCFKQQTEKSGPIFLST